MFIIYMYIYIYVYSIDDTIFPSYFTSWTATFCDEDSMMAILDIQVPKARMVKHIIKTLLESWFI